MHRISEQPFEALVTNESLEAITVGLDLRESDNVLAVCGSGDQAFAILEKARHVDVIDIVKWQLDFFNYRKQLLEDGNFERFLDPIKDPEDEWDEVYLRRRNSYFNPERLKRIQKKLSESLTLQWGDVRAIEQGTYSKIYLSNVLSYGGSIGLDMFSYHIGNISKHLSSGGLIYIADFSKMFRGPNDGDGWRSEISGVPLHEEEHLTARAKAIQKAHTVNLCWDSIVLKKS